MYKKTLCGLLSAAVLFGACPVSVLADDLILTESLDFRKADEDISGPGYSWDANSQILTLENFRAAVPAGKLEEKAAIYLPDESVIEIKGENIITTGSYHCDAIYCEGELWFEDNGTLDIHTDSFGACAIYAVRGPVIFDDSVDINIEPEGYIIYIENAKGNSPVISFREDAKLTFPAKKPQDRSVKITHKSSVDPSDNWLDYKERMNELDKEYVDLVAKDAKISTNKPITVDKNNKPAQTSPVEETPAPVKESTYEVKIGSTAMKKDGYVAYISDAKPYLSHGYTMLPLRALLNLTDADVDVVWNASSKTVVITDKTDASKIVMLAVGGTSFTCGEENISLSTPAELTDRRAFISLRDWMNILAALDMPASELSWNSKTKTVTFVK